MDTTIRKILTESQQLLTRSGICADDAEKIQLLMEKLETQELIISVIGQFKRGKTSFINTLLQVDLLPVGIIPVTSVVTKIRYGKGCATISYDDGREETVALEVLEQYISEQNNPENSKGVAFVNLELPCEFLSNRITIVDTPGVGSIHQHNTDDAYSFMKESDAVIFMLSVDSPINEIEREFLAATKNHASKFYFAVNKIDTIKASDQEAYLNYCQTILNELMAMDRVELFPISARKNTGIDTLMAAIRADVNQSAEAILSESVRIKLREILSTALSHLELYHSALIMPLDNLEAKKIELTVELKNLDSIIKEASYLLNQKLDDLLERLKGSLESQAQQLGGDLTAALKTCYIANCDQKPKQLEQALKEVLATDLKIQLTKLSDQGLVALEAGYQEAVDFLNRKIDDLKDFLSQVISELFGIDCHYETTTHNLTTREDFYVQVGQDYGALLLDVNDLIYLLPRHYANQKLYGRFLKKMQIDTERNINNMIYNYQYKLRESVRSFKSIMASEADSLRHDIEDVVNRVIMDKEKTSGELGGKISEMNALCQAVRGLAAKL